MRLGTMVTILRIRLDPSGRLSPGVTVQLAEPVRVGTFENRA